MRHYSLSHLGEVWSEGWNTAVAHWGNRPTFPHPSLHSIAVVPAILSLDNIEYKVKFA
jgi:hypothetical protein